MGERLSGVAVAGVTGSGVTITWTTNELATSQVEYGPDSNYGMTTPLDGYMVTSHSVVLGGLSPKTTYHYRVKSKDVAGNEARRHVVV